MPSGPPPSQPDATTPGWQGRDRDRDLLAHVQRMAIPELTRVFGQHGLYLRPMPGEPSGLSGNMLGNVLNLHREADQLAGQVRCFDAQLPIASGCLSLVYSVFMLESSPDPAALVHEFARCLQPEGTALVISINPWSPAQLRWGAPVRLVGQSLLERFAASAGLEVVRRQYVGPFWQRQVHWVPDARSHRWVDRFRAANLMVLRRREAGLTPLRKVAAPVSLRPGMSAG